MFKWYLVRGESVTDVTVGFVTFLARKHDVCEICSRDKAKEMALGLGIHVPEGARVSYVGYWDEEMTTNPDFGIITVD